MAPATIKTLMFIFLFFQASESKNCTCVGYYDCFDEEYMPHKFQITLEELGGLGCANPHNVCCQKLEPPSQHRSFYKGCGYHNPQTYRWSAQLLIKRDPYVMPTYKCGISFIHEMVAITTSFCVQEKGEFLVKVGASIRNITKIHKHPDFNASTFRNDVALLVLETPFPKGEIDVVCVPPRQAIFMDETECIMAPKSKGHRRSLNVMAVSLMDSGDCVKRFKNTTYDIYVSSAEVICVEDVAPKGYCGEDAGGPLFCSMGAGRYLQVGLGAWSIGCSENVPRVYVNLIPVRRWIIDFLDENGFNESSSEDEYSDSEEFDA